jgi:hypothetical protein
MVNAEYGCAQTLTAENFTGWMLFLIVIAQIYHHCILNVMAISIKFLRFKHLDWVFSPLIINPPCLSKGAMKKCRDINKQCQSTSQNDYISRG